MDEETRKLLIDMAEAIEALLVALQVQQAGDDSSAEYSVREAVRRVNRVRRLLQSLELGGPGTASGA